MSARPAIDPQHARYQSKGAVVRCSNFSSNAMPPGPSSISRTPLDRRHFGLHLSKMRGRGIDFEEFRPYQAGDDIRLIDWRVTARTSRPFTKVFGRAGRPVIIAVDQSRNMYFGSQVAFNLSLRLKQPPCSAGWQSIMAIGLAVWSTRTEVPAWSDPNVRDALLAFAESGLSVQSRAAASHLSRRRAGTEPEFQPGLATALSQIRRISKPGSTLYIISDFMTLDDKALQYMNQLSRHNNVICCLVYDVLEENLPVPGIYSITDGSRKGALNT